MLSIIQLSMRFGAKVLFKDVSLQFNPGNRYGLVGANGCGKSTLIKILTKEVTPENGEVNIPLQVTLGSLSQDHYRYRNDKVLHVVLRGKERFWEALEKKNLLLEKEGFNDKDCEALVCLEKTIEEHDGYGAEAEAAKLLEGLGVREEWHHRPLDLLSGGYKLRVLLAQVLFGKPDLLILDEPTNHLDLYSIKWLEDYLRNFPGTLILTSHDKEFLNSICTHIADVDYGTIKIYKGDFDCFHQQKQLDQEQKEHMLEKHDKRRADLQDFIDRFGAKATKARQAKSKAGIVKKIEEEMESLEQIPSSRLYPKLNFDMLRHSGVTVLKAQEISKAFNQKKVLEKVSFEIERGEKVAIIGPNGIGKSTLLEILNGRQTADHGSYNWGFATRVSYFPQDHAKEVNKSLTLLEWLGQFDREISQEQLRELLGRVLFSGETVNQPISTLSGGETARLLLAKMMLQKPNVLVFDEPTNHLDMEAIEELAQALEKFEGTLLLVSHNRYFVSRIATRILEISYEGVKDFKGSYTEYIEKQSYDLLSKRPVPNQRESQKVSKTETVSPSTYEDQKRLRSQKAQIRKKIEQAEERCHQLELSINKIDFQMASEGFYEITSRDEQQQLIKQKSLFEHQLAEVMDQWEKASLELQRCEESQ